MQVSGGSWVLCNRSRCQGKPNQVRIVRELSQLHQSHSRSFLYMKSQARHVRSTYHLPGFLRAIASGTLGPWCDWVTGFGIAATVGSMARAADSGLIRRPLVRP